ncbi:MAG TPA: LysR family transcriptional regulator [Desulfuromonadaceae bacterium]|nr:LysR family transcriptional regulator [Desulfuromonadaceae bacterium]
MKSKSSLLPRLRVVSGKKIAFGPGKADLLALVAETGSIGEAAERMDMSYMRAWSLVQTMNDCFREPVVEAVRGGNKHGGARLTETGRQVLRLYRRMESASLKASKKDWATFQKLLGK